MALKDKYYDLYYENPKAFRQMIADMYYDQELSIQKIHKITGFPYRRISFILHTYFDGVILGRVKKKAYSPELINKIGHLYYEKQLSAKKVASMTGIGEKTVKKILNEHHTGIRTTKEVAAINAERLKGRKFTGKTLENMRKAWQEKRTTPEYRKKLSTAMKGSCNHQSKLDDGKVKQIREEYSKLLMVYKKTEAQYYLAKKYSVKRSMFFASKKHVPK